MHVTLIHVTINQISGNAKFLFDDKMIFNAAKLFLMKKKRKFYLKIYEIMV